MKIDGQKEIIDSQLKSTGIPEKSKQVEQGGPGIDLELHKRGVFHGFGGLAALQLGL